MILFFTQYTNLQRAKDGLLELYKMAVKQDSALMEEVLCKAVLDSLSKDKRKAKPVIKHVINSLKGFISIEAQGYVSALVKDYKNQL